MPGPWEKYQSKAPAVEAGPWTKYQSAPAKGDGVPDPAPDTSGVQLLTDFARRAGASIPFSDEFKSAIQALPALLDDRDFMDEFSRNQAENQSELERIDREAPAALKIAADTVGLGSTIAGGGVAAKAAGLAPKAGTVLEAMGQGAVASGVAGAIAGAGEGEGKDRLTNAAVSAAVGGGVGLALPGVAAGISKSFARKQAEKAAIAAAPDEVALNREAKEAFKAADKSGLVISQTSYQRMADDLADITENEGLDFGIHKKAFSAMRRVLKEKGTEPDLKKLNTLRKVMSGAAKSQEADERRIASIMIEKYDDYLDKLTPSDVSKGNPRVAAEALKKARFAWSRMRKSELIVEAVDKAKRRADSTGGGGNLENAIRQNIRGILDSKKLSRGFSKGEKELLERVVRGTTKQSLTRVLGKFAPTGVVSTVMSGGAGGAVGGPVGAVALPLAGHLARRGSERMTNEGVQNALAAVRSGQLIGEPANKLLTLDPTISIAGGVSQNHMLPLLRPSRQEGP